MPPTPPPPFEYPQPVLPDDALDVDGFTRFLYDEAVHRALTSVDPRNDMAVFLDRLYGELQPLLHPDHGAW